MRQNLLTLSAMIAVSLAAGTAVAQTNHSGHAGQGAAATTTTTPQQAQPPFVVPFTRGGTSVDDEMEPMLDRAVAYAQSNRTMGVVITGIANDQGTNSARASRARAMANNVREYMRDNGVPESRTRTAAEGDAQVGSQNRVEITFVAR
jgi:outer membrane protein OmpA-like peptidoglycan-associated protein